MFTTEHGTRWHWFEDRACLIFEVLGGAWAQEIPAR
jgi:hypothetical protein